MKTEERHAEMGETVLIVRTIFPVGYKRGDKLPVMSKGEDGIVSVYTGSWLGEATLWPSEYEVIIEEDNEHAEA